MSLKKQTFLGLIWAFLDTLFIRGLMFVSMIVLARWIGPTQFGLIGMIAVFLAVGKSLTDSGMTSSLIRTKETNQSDYSTVFIVNLIISIVVYSLAYFAAPLISDFYGYKILTDLIRVYCLVFFLAAFSAVQLAILTKSMNFKKIAYINFPSTLIGASIGLYLGYKNYGVWSIVWMFLCVEFLRNTLLWIFSDWKPNFIFSVSKFKLHFSFGFKLVLSDLIATIFKNIYNILIGKYYSAEILGFFERSKQFSEYPSSTLTGVIDKVTYPMLSEVKNEPLRLVSIYKKLIRVSFYFISPIMLGLAAIAKPLFSIILGEEWMPAVIFFQIICFGKMLYPIHAFNLNILKTFGRSDLFLKLELIKKIIVSFTILIAFQFGILGLVWSGVFTSFASLGVNMYYSSRLINYKVKSQISDLIPILFQSMITSLLIYYIINLNIFENQLLLHIFLSVLVGLIFYFSISFFNKKSALHQALLFIKTRNQ